MAVINEMRAGITWTIVIMSVAVKTGKTGLLRLTTLTVGYDFRAKSTRLVLKQVAMLTFVAMILILAVSTTRNSRRAIQT